MFGAFAAEGRPWLVPFTAQETTPQPRHFTRVSSVRACVCVCVCERARMAVLLSAKCFLRGFTEGRWGSPCSFAEPCVCVIV